MDTNKKDTENGRKQLANQSKNIGRLQRVPGQKFKICSWNSNTCGKDTWVKIEQVNTELSYFQQMNAQSIWHRTEPAHAPGKLKITKRTRFWQWMLSNWSKQNKRPLVLTIKKDGTLRLHLDHCNLNAVSILDSHPIHCVECIDSTGDVTIFLTLDAFGGYWLVEFVEEHREKATWASYYRLIRFVRLPVGLKEQPRRSKARWISNYPWINDSWHWFTSMLSSYFQSPRTNISMAYDKSWNCWPTLPLQWRWKSEFSTNSIDYILAS